MIASIFKKSKPINFILVLVLVLVSVVYSRFFLSHNKFTIDGIIKGLWVFLVCSFMVFLLNFIVVKNKLAQGSSYHILFLGLLLAIFPNTFNDTDLLLSSVFLMLAMRRLISLRSEIDVKKKLFDASIWISVATLFYFWAILFFPLIFIALLLYSDNRIKNWIVPFIGFLTVAILWVTYHLIRFDSLGFSNDYWLSFKLDLKTYLKIKYIIPIIIVFTFVLWSTVYYLRSMKEKLRAFRPSHKIIVASTIISLLAILPKEVKNTSELVLAFPFFSIIITNYMENINNNILKEVIIYVFVLLTILNLIL